MSGRGRAIAATDCGGVAAAIARGDTRGSGRGSGAGSGAASASGAAAGAGDRIFFREGSFTWEHVAMVCERIQISGDDKSCLLGAWLLQADTAGLFQGVCCASKHHNEPAAVLLGTSKSRIPRQRSQQHAIDARSKH